MSAGCRCGGVPGNDDRNLTGSQIVMNNEKVEG